MRTLEAAFSYDHALVFGIGGSGDVVGTIPTARLLESHGVSVTVGGIAWEPTPRDPVVGPRSLGELEGCEKISETVGLVSGETRTTDGVVFSETRVAEHVDNPVVLIDVTQGVDGMIDGLDSACDRLGIDLVIGTDSGGDVLAVGDEPGLRSPVSDGLGLVALESISRDTCVGVFGYGSDGELTLRELNERIARIADRDGLLGAWGLTPRILTELEQIVARIPTEASRLPVEAARGALGDQLIRGGEVLVDLVPPSTVTFYFTPESISADSMIAAVVREHRSLSSVQAAFEDRGLVTEFEREVSRLAQS